MLANELTKMSAEQLNNIHSAEGELFLWDDSSVEAEQQQRKRSRKKNENGFTPCQQSIIDEIKIEGDLCHQQLVQLLGYSSVLTVIRPLIDKNVVARSETHKSYYLVDERPEVFKNSSTYAKFLELANEKQVFLSYHMKKFSCYKHLINRAFKEGKLVKAGKRGNYTVWAWNDEH